MAKWRDRNPIPAGTRVIWGSGPTSQRAQTPPAMLHGNDENVRSAVPVVRHVGESPQGSRAEVAPKDCVHRWVVSNPLDCLAQGLQKLVPESRQLSFVPSIRRI